VKFVATCGIVAATSFMLALTGCSVSDNYKAETAVRSLMRDPESVQFQGVSRCGGDTNIWNGNYNAKNAFGAYTGFKPFYYDGQSVVLLENYNFSNMTTRCYSHLKGDDSPGITPSEGASNPPGITDLPDWQPKALARSTPADDQLGDEEGEVESSPLPDPKEVCWADYCPCETSHPDYGFMDITLCRKITMGRPVRDDEYELGAAGRDARKALREYKAEYGGDF